MTTVSMSGQVSAVALASMALIGTSYWLNSEAEHKWESVTAVHSSLHSARSAIGILDWLNFAMLSDEEIIAVVAPVAVKQLSAIVPVIDAASEVSVVDQAKTLVAVSNDLTDACSLVPGAIRPECYDDMLSGRFNDFESSFESVSFLLENHYLTFTNGVTTFRDLTLFSSSLCNYDAGPISTHLTTDFGDDERLADETTSFTLGVGECRDVLSRKLRASPRLAINATGDEQVAARLRTSPEFRRVWGDSTPAWRQEVGFDTSKTDLPLRIDNPGLCYGRQERQCGSVTVGDPATFAKALHESIVTERAVATANYDTGYRFTIGARFVMSNQRDQVGVVIASVRASGPADRARLVAGDRMTAIAGRPVFNEADVIAAVNDVGITKGYRAPLPVEIIRNGIAMEAVLPIEYNSAYYYERYNWLGATALMAADAFSLGLMRPAFCYAARPLSYSLGFHKTDITAAECSALAAADLAAIRIFFPASDFFGTLIGTVLSPVRGAVAARLTTLRLFGARRVANVARLATATAITDLVAETAQARPGESFESIVRRTTERLPVSIFRDFTQDVVLPRSMGSR